MCQSKIKPWEKWCTRWWVLWVVFFTCTAAMAVFIQLILLPYILPQAHLGHGLFVFDSGGFHQIAANKATEMKLQGWKAWELRPNGLSPAGIASIFYYLWRPEPYSLIPFNAALNATAGCLVFFLLNTFIKNRLVAASGAALFILNPATLEWTTQIHKDSVFIVGNLLILSTWLILIRSTLRKSWLGFLVVPILTLTGSLLIWISRPYWNQVSIAACVLLLLITFTAWLPRWIFKRKLQPYHLIALSLSALIIAIQLPFVDLRFSLIREAEYIYSLQTSSKKQLQEIDQFSKREHRTLTPAQQKDDIMDRDHGVMARPQPKDDFMGRDYDVMVPSQKKDGPIDEEKDTAKAIAPTSITGRPEAKDIKWVHNPYLPKVVDTRLYSLSFFRRVTGSQGGKTLLDRHIIFNSISDFIMYLPRAIQIGFFSPFPTFWIGSGSIPANTIGRKIMGIIMAFSYLCFPFLLLSFLRYRKNLEFWILVSFCTFGLLVFTYAYPNVGTLNRLRYGFFSILIAIGFTFGFQKFLEYRSKKSPSETCHESAETQHHSQSYL